MVKQKKILLVNPACLDKRAFGEDAYVVPIGLYYIGALLKDNGFNTDIINLAAGPSGMNSSLNSGPVGAPDNDPANVFTEIISNLKPDIVGFSVTNPNRFNAMECAKIAKKINPDITIVFGGPAPTFLFEHLINECPQIDFIVKGEGEITFLELINHLEMQGPKILKPDTLQPNTIKSGTIEPAVLNHNSLNKIAGLVFKHNDKIIQTPERQSIGELDNLVHPSKYFIYQHLSMSRGCPGKCSFCGSPKFWRDKALRFHSPAWFANEIQALAKNGITHFYISDDTFTMDKELLIELCRLITKRELNITWNAISRVDYIDKDILFHMRKAGCIQLSFGVESGSEKIRKRLGKPIARQKIIDTFNLTTSHGILPRAYFIYGAPGETQKTIQESIDILKQIKPLSAIFYMLVIYPGTHLYQSAKDKNLVTDDIWHEKIEDLPWFEVDDTLDFKTVKAFGDQLRYEFYSNLDIFAKEIELADIKELYSCHADFLSRLAMTFSHGEYAKKNQNQAKNQDRTATLLFEKALYYAPDTRAFLGLAMLYQKQRNFDKAILILDKGLEQTPGNKDLNICMGVCLMNKEKFDAALPFFEKFERLSETSHYINICHRKISGQKI
jgi:anaerobic magnesium-protoporphyrin IX monomethyl ester cyclase